ncbi:MAG: alpha/beta hydrolase-fold protein [Spirochaetaceae bacterium]
MKIAATIRNTEVFIQESTFVNAKFKISVALPKNYNKNDKNYSVLYVMDSNIFYGLAVDTVRLLEYGKEIPELIIVGVGYVEDDKHMELRKRDYLPTHHINSINSGGANKFLSYLSEELIPHINENYRTKAHDLTLFGDSYSGLFALYTLFNRSNLFNRYIIGSPSIYWDNEVIFKIEEESNKSNIPPKAKLFLSVGELEAVQEPAFAKMVRNVEIMSERLENRSYPELEITTHIFESESHLSVIPGTLSRGLREVYK